MERLWTPWRSEYVTAAGEGSEECFFCAGLAGDDDESTHILYRGATTFVILNAYPYNTGHLMVAPKRHVAELTELTEEERDELMAVTTDCVAVLREAMSPHGFNLGMNLGTVAGAGVPGHLHMHVVPRWGGDTNFMPVIAGTKVLPEMIEQTYARLRPGFEELARRRAHPT